MWITVMGATWNIIDKTRRLGYTFLLSGPHRPAALSRININCIGARRRRDLDQGHQEGTAAHWDPSRACLLRRCEPLFLKRAARHPVWLPTLFDQARTVLMLGVTWT